MSFECYSTGLALDSRTKDLTQPVWQIFFSISETKAKNEVSAFLLWRSLDCEPLLSGK